jgi:hypothetical protein
MEDYHLGWIGRDTHYLRSNNQPERLFGDCGLDPRIIPSLCSLASFTRKQDESRVTRVAEPKTTLFGQITLWF